MKSMTHYSQIILAGLLLICSAYAQQAAAPAQSMQANAADAATSEEELRKASQNPIASLISVPLQNNTNFAIGPYGRTQNVLNIQPVIPVKIGQNWNLINRIIQPTVWQPYPNAASGGEYGLGDMSPTFFLSPSKARKVMWGVGPAFVIPTGTNDILGQGKFSMGPSLVVLSQPKPWTIGFLANNVWSVAGSGSRPHVNQMTLQVFLTYNLQKGWYVTSAPIFLANWKASSGNVWTVPVGGGVGRVMKVGSQPMNLSAQLFGNAVHPAGASSWGLRLQFVFLFPKLSKEQQKKMMEMKLKQLEKEEPKK